MKTGERIKKIRTKKKITQKQLAEMIGKNIRTIQKYESGDIEVPLESLFKISDALDINVVYLDESRFEDMNVYANELVEPHVNLINNESKNDELRLQVNEMKSLLNIYDEMISKLEKYQMSKSDTAILNTFKSLRVTVKREFLDDLEEKDYSYQIGYINASIDSIKFLIEGLKELLQEYE